MYRTINSTHKEQSFKHSQYLRLATIGIENPHGIISAVNTRHCKYNSISTNPKVPITQLHRLLRRNPRLWRIPIIYLFENHQSILNLNPKKNLIFFFSYAIYTKMKSLPRPWYLTKWRKPASRRSRNDVGAVETFCGAWVLMEEAADAEMRNLGHSPAILFLGKLNWIVDDEEEDPVRMSELRRRIGEVRGTEIVAAMAMDFD